MAVGETQSGIEPLLSRATAFYVFFMLNIKHCSLCPFQSVIPPAGTVLGHLQTTVRPVLLRPACRRDAAPPPAHKDSSSRTTSVKVSADTHAHTCTSVLVSNRTDTMYSLVYNLTGNMTPKTKNSQTALSTVSRSKAGLHKVSSVLVNLDSVCFYNVVT